MILRMMVSCLVGPDRRVGLSRGAGSRCGSTKAVSFVDGDTLATPTCMMNDGARQLERQHLFPESGGAKRRPHPAKGEAPDISPPTELAAAAGLLVRDAPWLSRQ